MRKIILILFLMLAVGVGYLAYKQTQPPINLSQFGKSFTCLPEDKKEAPFSVSLYILDPDESAPQNELVFLITMRDKNKQFLTHIAFSLVRARDDRGEYASEEETFSHYARTGWRWYRVSGFGPQASKDEYEKSMKKMTTLFKSQLPQKYQNMGFRELWESAGCTTHGPVPFYYQ